MNNIGEPVAIIFVQDPALQGYLPAFRNANRIIYIPTPLEMADSRRTVLITGCSQGGIGDALAQEFHNRGLRVFPSARNVAKMGHLQQLGLELIQLDVSDAESIRQAAAKVQRLTGGKLDFIVNNAITGLSLSLGSNIPSLSQLNNHHLT